MKRPAVISMAAFYLLLTTGMFVCIIHCSAETLVSKPPVMAMTHHEMAKHGAKKKCHSNQDCDCCKKHGTYVVKENIKPGFGVQFSLVGMVVAPPPITYYAGRLPHVSNTRLTDGKAPPGKAGKLISIQFRSLQI